MKAFYSFLVCITLMGCATTGEESTAGADWSTPISTKTVKGKKLPDFKYTTMDGKAVSLASYKGKVLILDIFSPT